MRIASKALKLRLEYGMKIGKPVSRLSLAKEANVDRNALARLEGDDTQRFDGDFIAALCAFYTKVLERKIDVGDILEYDPDIQSRTYAPPTKLSLSNANT